MPFISSGQSAGPSIISKNSTYTEAATTTAKMKLLSIILTL